MKLAFIGSMNDEIIIMDELACDLIHVLKELYPQAIEERYGITLREKDVDVLTDIAESRRCYTKGEQLDTEKAAAILMDDFRSGKLGRITLERQEQMT